MEHSLETNYGGAKLCLLFSVDDEDSAKTGHARLLINNIERDRTVSTKNTILRLSSTVQTEYEWHEFIEALVEVKNDSITASLFASKAKLKQVVITP